MKINGEGGQAGWQAGRLAGGPQSRKLGLRAEFITGH